jgi:uncharacterized protein (DUF362 family)/Pyruvate/2-oxoacid:ferredoxin oxidoreductase delta subunit
MLIFKDNRMSAVIISSAAYDEKLSAIIHSMMDLLVKDSIFPGAHVLLKPNLLIPSKPAQGITTHPKVVRAVAEYVLAKGAKVQVSDSPALGSFQKAIKDGGYLDTCKGIDIDWKPFSTSKKVDIGPPFGQIDIAADAMDADVVINLAKLKTHIMMCLTLGVKNMFGCIIGYEKPQWHVRAGIDRDLFAKLLVQICRAVRPTITLVDGILALEGQGPGKSGTPKNLGFLVGGRNPEAVDQIIAKIVKCPLDMLPTHQAATALGITDENPRVIGEIPSVDHFQLPVLSSTVFGPPPFQKFMRKHLIMRPVTISNMCQHCGICEKQCPATAITMDKTHLSFNYDRCIRCFCCVEVCPHGALHSTNTFLGKAIDLARKKFHKIVNPSRPPDQH